MKCFPFFVIAFLITATLVFSCNTDKLDPVIVPADCQNITYENTIKAIVDKSCAYSGCHLVGTYPPGNFSTYDGMKPFLSDALFKKFVIDLKDDTELGMPPSYAPAGNPQDLTTDELENMRCWVNNNYLEL